MANRFRPKGSYKDFLNLTSDDIAALSTDQLKGIVSKLNDVANKKMQRLEASGLGAMSPAFRANENKPFKSLRGKDLERADVKAEYLRARQFINAKTSTIQGTIEHNKAFDSQFEKIIGRGIDDPENFDKRYKKEKVLKKPVKKRLSDFWDKYHEWKEIQQKEHPDKAKGGTNEEDVTYFADELYNKGKRKISDFEKKAKEDYVESEEQIEKDNNNYDELPIGRVDAPRPKNSKQGKHEAKGEKPTIKQKFQRINILGDY